MYYQHLTIEYGVEVLEENDGLVGESVGACCCCCCGSGGDEK